MFFCGWEQRELLLISQITSKLFFPSCLLPQKWKTNLFSRNTWMTNFHYPLLIYFNLFLTFFFLHMTHMGAFYLPQKFYWKWSIASAVSSLWAMWVHLEQSECELYLSCLEHLRYGLIHTFSVLPFLNAIAVSHMA